MMRGSRCQGRSATPQGTAPAGMRCLTCEPGGQTLKLGAKDPCRQSAAVRRRWVLRQHARLLPSEHLSATFGDSCGQGTGSAASWGSTSCMQGSTRASLGGMYGRMPARRLWATDWSTAAGQQEQHPEPRLINCCSLFLCCRHRETAAHAFMIYACALYYTTGAVLQRKRDSDVPQTAVRRRQHEEQDWVLQELGPPPAGPQGRWARTGTCRHPTGGCGKHIRSAAELLGSVTQMHSSPSWGQRFSCLGARHLKVKLNEPDTLTPQASQAAAEQAREDRCRGCRRHKPRQGEVRNKEVCTRCSFICVHEELSACARCAGQRPHSGLIDPYHTSWAREPGPRLTGSFSHAQCEVLNLKSPYSLCRRTPPAYGIAQERRRQHRSGASPARRTEGQQEQSQPLEGSVRQPGNQMQDRGQEPPDEALPPPPSKQPLLLTVDCLCVSGLL